MGVVLNVYYNIKKLLPLENHSSKQSREKGQHGRGKKRETVGQCEK